MIKLFSEKLHSGLFKRTFVYTFSASLNALIAFLLLPLLTRYLSPYDYGIVETFIAFSSFLTSIVIMGGNTLLSKDYFNFDHSVRKNYIGNILSIIFITFIFLFVLVSIFSFSSNFLSNLLKISNILILLAVMFSFTNAINVMVLTLFQLEEKAKNFAMFINSKTFVEITISIFLIVALGMKWEGRIAGMLIGGLLFFGVSIVICRTRDINFMFSIHHAKNILLLGIPLVFAQLSGMTNEIIGKIMINNIIDVSSTGLYSVGYRFGMVVMIVETSFSRAWLPFFFKNIKENKYKNNLKIVKATYTYIIGLIVFAILFGIFAKYLLYIMIDKRFFAAGQFIFLISMAYCFDGIWKMFIGYLIHKGKTRTYSFIVFISASVNIVLTYILLKRIGLIGAAWATFISFGIGAALTLIVGIRSHPMPWLMTHYSKS